jgi:prevent-host-death family protein
MTYTDHRSHTVGYVRAHLGDVVADAAVRGQRTVITDSGKPSAVIMALGEVEDLEDQAAYAEWLHSGAPTVGTLEDSARELGLVISGGHGHNA